MFSPTTHFNTVFQTGLGCCEEPKPKVDDNPKGVGIPRLGQHTQNTEGSEGTHCFVKPQDRSRVFRSSPKIDSKKDQYCANEGENQSMDSLSTTTKQRGAFARGSASPILSRKRFEVVEVASLCNNTS